MTEITVTVDGVKYADHVEPRMLLVHYLRESSGRPVRPSDATRPTAAHAPC
jgi:hypothetical protein